mgnify:CR=1 FL=1
MAPWISLPASVANAYESEWYLVESSIHFTFESGLLERPSHQETTDSNSGHFVSCALFMRFHPLAFRYLFVFSYEQPSSLLVSPNFRLHFLSQTPTFQIHWTRNQILAAYM